MNTRLLPIFLMALAFAAGAQAESQSANEARADAAASTNETPPRPPQMSEIPVMKQQGERMAVLMEQLSKEIDPEIRRKIMAEAVCPQ